MGTGVETGAAVAVEVNAWAAEVGAGAEITPDAGVCVGCATDLDVRVDAAIA